MICFSLYCAQEHQFDSWFKSGAAFEDLAATGQLACPVCGDCNIKKSLMAPAVRPAEKTGAKQLSIPQNEAEAQLAELRRKVEENSEYVGPNFAKEARRMHEGKIDHRPIYGEADVKEAKEMFDDGIPIAPLPFAARNKVN